MSNGIAVPILLYHRVGTVNSDARRISLSPDLFREQMRWLRDHCDVVPLETLAAAIGCGRLPDRTAVITFDDGYFDVLTTVLPILAEFNLPATFFVNSANFDAGDEFWGDILERVFLEGTAIPEECPLPFAGDDSVLRTVTADERRAAWERINAAVYPLGAAERIRVVNAIASWSQLDLDARPSHRRMTAEEVAGLARAPHYEIGAHTVNHLRLTDHALDVRRHEIAANKRDLERATGRVVRSFAYPYGIYDDATVALVREAGFATAVTVDRGVARAESDPWRLPRVEPPAVDASRFSVFMRDIVAQDSDQS